MPSHAPAKMVQWTEAVSRCSLKIVRGLGSLAREHWRDLQYVAALIGTTLYTASRPRYWTASTRNKVARQVMSVGVEPLAFVCVLAAFVGISIVVQLTFWTGKAGQSQLLGPLLVAVVARELGP